jgi:hypothetical protein
MMMSVEHWWNDGDREKPKYWEKTLSHCNFIDHKLHMDWSGIEPGSSGFRGFI